MAVFPDEIVSDILSWCDDETLLVATQITKEAEWHLYRLIHMNSRQRCDQLLTAFAGDARRAGLVRGLRLMGLYDAIRTTHLLTQLDHLKRLNITPLCHGFGFPLAGFPFRLRALRLFGESDMLTPPDFIAFLEEQTEIEVLELVMSEDAARWAAVSARARDPALPLLLPVLKVLQARTDVILAFLERPRPLLQHVKVQMLTAELTYPDVDPQGQPVEVAPGLCTALTAAGADLQGLTIGTSNAGDTMRLLPGVMPGLDSLEIMIARGEAFDKLCDEFAHPDPSKWDIPFLPSLKRFVLHVVNMEKETECKTLVERHSSIIVAGMRHIMPALEDCELVVHWGIVENPTYLLAQVVQVNADTGRIDKVFADQEFFCGSI